MLWKLAQCSRLLRTGRSQLLAESGSPCTRFVPWSRRGKDVQNEFNSIEFCAGAGGQAIGLEQAGFRHVGLVEIEPSFAKTLTLNRPGWSVFNEDMNTFDGRPYKGVDLFAAGLPCPPFSIAGKQLGDRDERNLFPAALRLIDEIQPKAVMIENVRGFLSAVFEDYRAVP